MNFLLLFLFLIISSLNAQIMFCEADVAGRNEIQNSMNLFYAEQLVQAGVFEEEKIAQEISKMESDLAALDLDRHNFYYHLVSEDGKTYYGYFVYFIKEQMAYIDAIYLEEEYRGQGLGAQTLQYFETLLSDYNIYLIKLYVFDYNKKAIALYNKMGYEIDTAYHLNDKLIGYHLKKQSKNQLR